jgi:hypothetical protein
MIFKDAAEKRLFDIALVALSFPVQVMFVVVQVCLRSVFNRVFFRFELMQVKQVSIYLIQVHEFSCLLFVYHVLHQALSVVSKHELVESLSVLCSNKLSKFVLDVLLCLC